MRKKQKNFKINQKGERLKKNPKNGRSSTLSDDMAGLHKNVREILRATFVSGPIVTRNTRMVFVMLTYKTSHVCL